MTKILTSLTIIILFTLFDLSGSSSLPTGKKPQDRAEGTSGLTNDNGASRDFYNRVALLEWENFMGDWKDANGDSQGEVPFATADVIDNSTPKSVEWDVTSLVDQ